MLVARRVALLPETLPRSVDQERSKRLSGALQTRACNRAKKFTDFVNDLVLAN